MQHIFHGRGSAPTPRELRLGEDTEAGSSISGGFEPGVSVVASRPARMAGSIDEVLRERFGLEAFRPWQREAIEAVIDGPGKVLVVAPTGGGKSLTYQLPATILDGLTLVVSPLVALMEDQVRSLQARGIKATFLASTVELAERQTREAAMVRGEYELVYVAPERLANSAFIDRLSRCKLALIAIDEAHCIAQWGHDFRPEYLQIGALIERLAPPRILACTATATPAVRKEIIARLGLEDGKEVLRGFARPNLHLAAQNVDGPRDAHASLDAALEKALGEPKHPRGGAIVYAATRKVTEQYAADLEKKGWSVAAYHAGMPADTRSRVAERFANRKLDVVVATNAFGMGIDRSDIRVVVHVQPPSSIEAYYQEVGRAGRDGAEAMGLLLCSGADIGLRRRLVGSSDGGSNDAALAARAWGLFRDLLRYLDARSCRHDFVLRYFGDEKEVLGGCGHCDVCVAIDQEGESPETDSEEVTLTVKKVLSGVARAQKRGGLTSIAEMLLGKESEKAERFGFTSLSTFGLFKERPIEWIVALLRAVLAAGWIDLTATEHPVPYLTKLGAQVMKGEIPARIMLPSERAVTSGKQKRAYRPRAAAEAPALAGEDQALFERLRSRRAEIAKEVGMPAYVVAHDRTLVDMAKKRPRTSAALLDVHGMGPARIEQYGARFLELLA